MCDGHIVYQGSPLEAPAHFAKGNLMFPKFTNPADHAMKLLSVSYPKKDEDEALVQKVVKLYQDELKQEDEDLADSFKLKFELI